MNVVGVHHVSIGVRDVDAAVDFYRLLGLTSLARPDFGFPGAWLQAGDQQVHLIGTEVVPPGLENHYAFQVEDLEACLSELAAHDVEARRSSTVGAGRQAFIQDPSGNIVELNQPDRP